MVKNALYSIKDSTHTDWELAFMDDGSDKSALNVVADVLGEDLRKVKYYNTKDSVEDKRQRESGFYGGSIIGKHMNDAIQESDADICILLCDDDALLPDYMSNLSKYFTEHPEVMYAYSHIVPYDPLKESALRIDPSRPLVGELLGAAQAFNSRTEPTNPVCHLDASQVVWRRECNLAGCWFGFPRTKNLDESIYHGLFNKYGVCAFTGFRGQFKGIHFNQLCRLDANSYAIIDKEE